MTDLNNALVRDLARLASKYSPDDWEVLLAYVRDPERREGLTVLLQDLATVSRSGRSAMGPSESRSQPQNVGRLLSQIHEQEPDRALLLKNVWSGLLTRELLPEMASLRSFAEAVGLKELRATKREQAVNQLMRYLATLDVAVLQAAIERAAVADRGLAEEYERWVQLILNEGPAHPG